MGAQVRGAGWKEEIPMMREEGVSPSILQGSTQRSAEAARSALAERCDFAPIYGDMLHQMAI